MQRIPEPDLMNDEAQARAYAAADFSEPHDRFVALFRETFPHWDGVGCVLDLGCGSADVTLRFAHTFPAAMLHGVDGAPAMLACAKAAVEAAGCAGRIRLIQGYLPGAELPLERYDAVIANSLLHHLEEPLVLWKAIAAHAKKDAPVFVMDLMRPESPAEASMLTERYAAEDTELLRRDFYNSLLAAYSPDEVTAQLRSVGLAQLQVQVVSDRHLTVSGLMT